MLEKILEISATSPTEPIASCEPPLKPNQPIHSINVPKVASARFEPGIGVTLPSLAYLPIRGPKIMAPISAAHPPTECTTVEPAKSRKPIPSKNPPPHFQLAWIG